MKYIAACCYIFCILAVTIYFENPNLLWWLVGLMFVV